MDRDVLAEALAAGRRYITYLPTATCGHPEHIPSFEALAAVGVVEDAIRLTPQPEAGLDAELERLRRIGAAARERETAEERLADFESAGVGANAAGDSMGWAKKHGRLTTERAEAVHALRAALAAEEVR